MGLFHRRHCQDRAQRYMYHKNTRRRKHRHCVRSVITFLLPGESCADFIQYTPNNNMVKDHEDPRIKMTLSLLENYPKLGIPGHFKAINSIIY